MKYILFFIILFVGLENGDEPRPWRGDYKLSWEDFKGPVKENHGAVAVTASGITFSFNVRTTNDQIVEFNTSVEAHFHPNNSWYLKDKVNPYILAHEQLHFDITELHVRKLRKSISELQVNPNIKSQLKEMHISANEGLRAMQIQYDFESENSINPVNQEKWDLYVQLELQNYSEFRSK